MFVNIRDIKMNKAWLPNLEYSGNIMSEDTLQCTEGENDVPEYLLWRYRLQ